MLWPMMVNSSTGTGHACRSRSICPANDRQAAVVMQVHRREAEIARERRAVVVAFAPPLSIVHAQPVREQQDFAARIRDRGSQRIALQMERQAIATQLHWDRQRVAARGEMIAEHAVQRGEHSLAFGRCRVAAECRKGLRQQRIDPAADHARHPANGSIDQPGEAGRGLMGSPTKHTRHAEDIVMHGLDHAGQADRRIDGKPPIAAQVGGSNVGFSGHAARAGWRSIILAHHFRARTRKSWLQPA